MDAYPISIYVHFCPDVLTTRPYGADADLVGKFPEGSVESWQ
jgi:hypothetical protein